MTDPNFYIIMATAALAGLGMTTFAALTGWRGWLALKHQELTHRAPSAEPAAPSAATRIELADLKERIRKLEAIAAGVDL